MNARELIALLERIDPTTEMKIIVETDYDASDIFPIVGVTYGVDSTLSRPIALFTEDINEADVLPKPNITIVESEL
jgi:hypothetical protein